MSIPQEMTQTQAQPSQSPEKELNFKKQAEYYEKALQEERQRRLEAEAKIQTRAAAPSEEDEEDSEPYVDKRRLKKELNQFATKSKQDTQTEIQRAVNDAIAKERQQSWLKSNPDFYEVMQHAETFAKKDPEWAEEFLNLPEGFERQKLVYKSIKAMGLHKKEEPKPSIQDEIKNNRKGVYYSPSGVGSAPYQGYVTGGKEFSVSEKQTAYQKMQELKNKLRLG